LGLRDLDLGLRDWDCLAAGNPYRIG